MRHSLPGALSSPGDASVVQALLATHDDVEPAAQVVRLHVHDLGRQSIVAGLPLLLLWQARDRGQGILTPAPPQRRVTKVHTLETLSCGFNRPCARRWGVVRGPICLSGLRHHDYSLTCWKESSKSVCLETLIFTWLGRAFD